MNELSNDIKQQENGEEQSSFNFQAIFKAFILNWKWFLLSVIICVGVGFLYLRYSTPVYNVTAKLLIKDDNSDKRGGGERLAGAVVHAGRLAPVGMYGRLGICGGDRPRSPYRVLRGYRLGCPLLR